MHEIHDAFLLHPSGGKKGDTEHTRAGDEEAEDRDMAASDEIGYNSDLGLGQEIDDFISLEEKFLEDKNEVIRTEQEKDARAQQGISRAVQD